LARHHVDSTDVKSIRTDTSTTERRSEAETMGRLYIQLAKGTPVQQRVVSYCSGGAGVLKKP